MEGNSSWFWFLTRYPSSPLTTLTSGSIYRIHIGKTWRNYFCLTFQGGCRAPCFRRFDSGVDYSPKNFHAFFHPVLAYENSDDIRKNPTFELRNFRGVGAQPAWRAVWPHGCDYEARLVILTPWQARLSVYSCWCRVYFDSIGQGIVSDDRKWRKSDSKHCPPRRGRQMRHVIAEKIAECMQACGSWYYKENLVGRLRCSQPTLTCSHLGGTRDHDEHRLGAHAHKKYIRKR